MSVLAVSPRSSWAAIPAVLSIAAVSVALHLLGLGLPFINQEDAFNGAAAYFSGRASDLQAFFQVEANTVTLPFLAGLLSKSTGLPPDLASRILSISAIGAFVYAMKTIADALKAPTVTLLLLTVSAPLVWVYSGRGTADFAPAAIAFLAIAILWTTTTRRGWRLAQPFLRCR